MIQNFINEICKALNIPTPAISYNTSNFETSTMMAQVDSEGKTIFLKKYNKPNPDQFFSIAHELRHIWQIYDNKDFYFSSYKTVEQCESLDEYNLQIAEIDANSFAGLVMIKFFRLQPMFKGLSDTVKTEIYKHMNIMKDTGLFG